LSGTIDTVITITGTDFGAAQGTSTVAFNGVAAPVTSWSASSIVASVPGGATSGKVVVTVGGVASNGSPFTVDPLQGLPSLAQVQTAIEDVNGYWIANNAAGNTDWPEATYFAGDLAAYDATGVTSYLRFAESWASKGDYSLLGGNTTNYANSQAAGQVYIRLYQLSGTASDLTGISESLNGMVSSSVVDEWTWTDAINMSMPDFAELGAINGNTNYYTKMYSLYHYAKDTLGLYDSANSLWWENATYVNTATHWSRANGWAFAAHAKVLSVLPKTDPHYAEYLSTFKAMAKELAALQVNPGGYWNSDLIGTEDPGPESSGTAFFLYGFTWGINNGILDLSYLPTVENAWNFFTTTAIQPPSSSGCCLLGYVQPAGSAPGPAIATTTEDFGVGAYLLAARQMALLTSGGTTTASNPIVPYIDVNGTITEENTATVASGATVSFEPQPATGGTWSWTGPGGFTSTSREIPDIALSTGANVYTATYTPSGSTTSYTETFTITVTPSTCTPTLITPYIQLNGSAWQETSAATTASCPGYTVNLGPQPSSGGSWAWTGPNGFTSVTRQLNDIALTSGANVYTATYTNAAACKSSQVFTITVSGACPGFTISSSAATLSVAQGAAATDTITVTGATASVTLAASGLPAGVTAAFGTNPTTGSSVLTFTASSTAASGSYTVTITGTSGALTATATVTLVIGGCDAAGFSLAPLQATLSLAQGGTATDTITVSEFCISGSVTLIASGLPAGVTAKFAPNPTTSTSVVTFTASATAAAGTYAVTIIGVNGSLTAPTTIALTVSARPPSSSCTVDYVISPQNSSAFGAALTIVNNSSTALSNWTLTWTFANGQTVTSLWNGNETQSGANVTVTNESYNGSIAAGGSLTGVGFNGAWNGTTNSVPAAFSLNGTACTVN
jgi:rhamnogalacturonyl hydrolase YesR